MVVDFTRGKRIGDIVSDLRYPKWGVIVGIMGFHCKVKYINAYDGEITFWYGPLYAVYIIDPQDIGNCICPWERIE